MFGHTFLMERDEKKWPSEEFPAHTANDRRKETETVVVTVARENLPLPDIHRFSKGIRLIRSTVRVLKFIKILKHLKTTAACIVEELTVDELQAPNFPG
ncbi:hypothetical protein JTB14_003053 [Gonioctena quinquepunctata]|nr:hypothetical protein JTB14_003053 [Gonioctena quinquepunctata]